MSLLGSFSKDTIVYGLGRGIKKFIGFLLLPVYTRALSPAEFGILDTLGAALFFITAFFGLGLDSASGYYFFKPQDEKERGKILFTVFVLRLAVIFPCILLSFYSDSISYILFHTREYSTAVLITCLLIPCTMLMSEQELIYRFHRNAWGYNSLTIIKSLANIAAGVLLVVHYQLGIKGAQAASLFSTLTVILVSFFTFTRKKYHYQFSFAYAKKLIRFGFPLVWAGLAVWVYSVSDRFFLLYFRNAGEVGFYSIGNTFSQPIGLISMAVQMSFGVLFYDIFHKESDDKPMSKQLMSKVLYLYISISSIITIGISLFSYELVGFITTSEYLPGIVVIPIICVAGIFAQLSEIVPVGISISEKTWHYTWIIAVAALVNAGLNFIFIPLMGFLGAALTTLAAYIIYFSLSDYISRAYFNAGFSRLRIYLYLLITFCIAFIFPYLQLNFKITNILALKVIVFAFFLFLPIFFKFISASQINTIYKYISARIGI